MGIVKMKCEHCNEAEATEKLKIQKRGEEGYRTMHLCESCMKRIGEGELSMLDIEAPPSASAVAVAISKSDSHIRIEIKAPLRPGVEALTDEEFAAALLGFVARQMAGEAAEKRGKDH